MTDLDRAIDQIKELLDARLGGMRVEIRALRERLDDRLGPVTVVQEEVADLQIRTTALEAMDRSREKRLTEARAYRRVHVPTFLFAGASLCVAFAGLLVAAL